jgi:uncharacterized protein
MKTASRARMLACAGAAAIAFCSTLALAATADDDFRAGLRSYQSGDMIGAMATLRKPADQGHAAAQALLAEILDRSDYNEEAVAYYRKAADQGHPEGEYGLGTMYASGEGVKKDLVTARTWFTKAAEKGHTGAVHTLAQAYISGGLGLDDKGRIDPTGLQWIRKAADSSYLPALEYLGKAYRTGSAGLAVDLKQAEAFEARARTVRGIKAEKGKKGSRT